MTSRPWILRKRESLFSIKYWPGVKNNPGINILWESLLSVTPAQFFVRTPRPQGLSPFRSELVICLFMVTDEFRSKRA
jgi:hypothetical protein